MPFTIKAPINAVLGDGFLRQNALDLMLSYSQITRDAADGFIIFSNIPDEADMRFEHVQGIVLAGGEVENWPCFLVIPQDEYSEGYVPEFFPDAQLLTWAEWCESATPAITPYADGNSYVIPANAHGSVLGSALAQITEYQVLNKQQAPGPFNAQLA